MTRRPLRGRDGGGRRGSPSEVVGTSQNTPLESLDEWPSEINLGSLPEPPSSQESLPEPPSSQESSPELPSSRESLPEPPSSQCPMELLEKDPGIVFFEFKEVEGGIMGFVALEVISKWLLTVSQICCNAKTTDRDGSAAQSQYSYFHLILNGKVLIGHNIRKSDWPKLVDKFKHIGLDPPQPLKIIDTAPFIRSNTKLAQLSVFFGFGNVRYSWLDAWHVNRIAIMKCRAAMSILDDMEKAVPGYYPIICHIMKFDDESKSGIEKEEEKSPLKALAECPSEVLHEGSSSQYPMEDHPGVVLFHFKKDRFGKKLNLGAVEVNSKTLKSSNHVGFCIKPIDKRKRVNRFITLEQHEQENPKIKYYRYRDVCDILNGKMWIGYDILKSDWPRLLKEFKHIGLAHPTPLKIIDTAHFIRSNTKLAKLAVLCGLGEPVPSIFAPFEYLAAIKECGVAMSILDMEEEQDEFHPMISHLMKFKQPEIRKSERLRGIEG